MERVGCEGRDEKEGADPSSRPQWGGRGREAGRGGSKKKKKGEKKKNKHLVWSKWGDGSLLSSNLRRAWGRVRT